MAEHPPFLIADRLTRCYSATIALDQVDLAAAEGSVLAVLGPNGCGKTTTVRIFATLLRPDSGHALVGGHDVVTSAAAVRAMIGLAGQYAAVDPFLTGRENLELVAELRHLPPGERHRDASLLLERLGLADAAGVPRHGRRRRARPGSATSSTTRTLKPGTRRPATRSSLDHRQQSLPGIRRTPRRPAHRTGA